MCQSGTQANGACYTGVTEPGACSIALQTTANLQLVWVGVQAIEQLHLKQTANFHCKQWRLTFDGSVSFGWVQTWLEICGAIEYTPDYDQDQSTTTLFGHAVVLKFQDHSTTTWGLSSDLSECGPRWIFQD